jgi:hypothetical protein
MDTPKVKNGHEHSTDSSPSKTQTTIKEEISNDDINDNQESMKDKKDMVSKAEVDQPATGSNRDSSPTHTHSHRGEKQVKVRKLIAVKKASLLTR